MVGQSEQEIAQVIESEITGYHDPEQRYGRLLKHTAELADRWIGFATIRTLSSGARVTNDLFRALQVSLRMTLDSVPAGETRPETSADLQFLLLKTSDVVNSCDNAAIEELVGLLSRTLPIDLSRP